MEKKKRWKKRVRSDDSGPEDKREKINGWGKCECCN